jgi:hypothetical protein
MVANMTIQRLRFRWNYVIFPAIILLGSTALALLFSPTLPAQVAYNFRPSDTSDNLIGRVLFLVWGLTPQLFLFLLASVTVWGATYAARRLDKEAGGSLLQDRTLFLMGNLFALPQLILSFAMADVFVYNLNRTHLMPLWFFALLVMVIGAILLGVFFVRALRQATGKEKQEWWNNLTR